MIDSAEGNVSIERVFSRAFGSLGKNALIFLGAIFGLGFLPMFVVAVLFALLFHPPFSTPAIVAAILMGLAILLALYSLVAGSTIHATVVHSQGRRARFGECIEVAFRRLVPIMIVTILSWLAIVAASFLLLVPGIILAVIWAVIVPVSVEEQVGIGQAFGRAAELSRGARWKVFGIALLVFLIALGISLIINLVAGTPATGVDAQSTGAIGADILRLVVSMIETAFWIAIQAALYVELRESKEGPVEATLGEIFA